MKNRDEVYLLYGDNQGHRADPACLELLCQIGETLRLQVRKIHLVNMGDEIECESLSSHLLPMDTVGRTLQQEIEGSHKRFQEIVSRIKPNGRRIFLAGNHEDRLARQLLTHPEVVQILNLEGVSKALSVSTLLRLKQFGFNKDTEPNVGNYYGFGEYLLPTDGTVATEDNLYATHGDYTAPDSGQSARKHTRKRYESTAVGHCHRLAAMSDIFPCANGDKQKVIWQIETGHMSRLGVVGQGENLYSSHPHRNPAMMNHQQGFVVLTRWAGAWYPELVQIRKGRAWFRGKNYKA
jgi:hypothetical protein